MERSLPNNLLRLIFSIWCLGTVTQPASPRKYKRCAASIFNYNGVEVLLGESLMSRVVVLYLMKRRCERLCFSQLQGLNDLGAYYNKTGHKVTVIALKPRNSPPVDHFKRYLPFVGIYEEPRSAYTNTRIIHRLRGDGGWKEILIYGKCGEQRFHYGYPYSSMTEPFINLLDSKARHLVKRVLSPFDGIYMQLLSYRTGRQQLHVETVQGRLN